LFLRDDQYQLFQSPGQIQEGEKIKLAQARHEHNKEALEDAMQWEVIQDDFNKEVLFISKRTGEIRAGDTNALQWRIDDDGSGYPCFINEVSGAVVHDDPRFVDTVDKDIMVQRRYIMEEIRYALYFCEDFWDRYKKTVEASNEKEKRIVTLQIRDSIKRKQLASLLLRAKNLFKNSSITDSPVPQNILDEIAFAQWIAARLNEISLEGEELIRKRKEMKSKFTAEYERATDSLSSTVVCHHCGRNTARHLDRCEFCQHLQIS
jgi:hypothetical protein